MNPISDEGLEPLAAPGSGMSPACPLLHGGPHRHPVCVGCCCRSPARQRRGPVGAAAPGPRCRANGAAGSRCRPRGVAGSARLTPLMGLAPPPAAPARTGTAARTTGPARPGAGAQRRYGEAGSARAAARGLRGGGSPGNPHAPEGQTQRDAAARRGPGAAPGPREKRGDGEGPSPGAGGTGRCSSRAVPLLPGTAAGAAPPALPPGPRGDQDPARVCSSTREPAPSALTHGPFPLPQPRAAWPSRGRGLQHPLPPSWSARSATAATMPVPADPSGSPAATASVPSACARWWHWGMHHPTSSVAPSAAGTARCLVGTCSSCRMMVRRWRC